jgi:DNA-binding NtrC family response regulator
MEAKISVILVIDDDLQVVWMLNQLLKSAGHKVLTAGGLAAARAVWQSECENIDLVLVDHLLPDGSGLEFAQQVLNERHDTGVILMSGAPPEPDPASTLWAQIKILEKPFTIARLYGLVSASLLKFAPVG